MTLGGAPRSRRGPSGAVGVVDCRAELQRIEAEYPDEYRRWREAREDPNVCHSSCWLVAQEWPAEVRSAIEWAETCAWLAGGKR